jgi:peroxiredoxin Q/BCP
MRKSVLSLLLAILATCGILRAENPDEFTLHSATNDSTFQLSAHAEKTVVLHFLLKTECPYCLKYTRQYAAFAEEHPETIHVFVKPDTVEEIRRWTARLDKSDLKELPAIYRDPDASLAKKFGIPDGYKFHGESVHYPAMIILDKTGKEIFRYVGKSNSDRLPLDQFTAKLKELSP